VESWRSEINESVESVWRYAPFFSLPQGDEGPLVLGDGRPRYDRVDVSGSSLEFLLCQREDLNPSGSHKDRSLAVQVNAYRAEGARELCISSSGNAAIAAAAACREAGITFYAFISPSTSTSKIHEIQKRGALVVVSSRAIGLAKEVSSAHQIPNLRPSVDDRALEGYKSLAFQWVESEGQNEVDSLFCYTTSGSTLCGIWRGFTQLQEKGWKGKALQLHAAQAGEIASIAARFGEESAQKGRSVIGDLGTRRTRRLGEVVRSIRSSGGHAWALCDAEILEAKSWLSERGIEACAESACAMAAALKAAKQGRISRPLVLLTGHASHDEHHPIEESAWIHLESLDEWEARFRRPTP
jgi:threonine synthase